MIKEKEIIFKELNKDNKDNKEKNKDNAKILKKKDDKSKEKDKETIITTIKEKDINTLADYELNHLSYEKTLEKDKRNFCEIYCSIIKRDELFLFTFVTCNDYNLFYIKIEKFIIVILTIMAMNAFLFADETIHKYFINGVKYNFNPQILQIILSIIITHIFEILLCFFTFTDKYYYQIKALKKPETEGKKIIDIFRKIKIKLIIFFVLMFILSLFYWYFVSAFCAVYNNTQKLFIIDCVLSFLFFLVDPFIIYALISLIRLVAIKNKVKWLFKVSRIFPIF